jgi:hypothetical protein
MTNKTNCSSAETLMAEYRKHLAENGSSAERAETLVAEYRQHLVEAQAKLRKFEAHIDVSNMRDAKNLIDLLTAHGFEVERLKPYGKDDEWVFLWTSWMTSLEEDAAGLFLEGLLAGLRLEDAFVVESGFYDDPSCVVSADPMTNWTKAFLAKARMTDDPEGDLITDMRSDPNIPRLFKNFEEIRGYVRDKGGCPEAVKAVAGVWIRYRRWLDRWMDRHL